MDMDLDYRSFYSESEEEDETVPLIIGYSYFLTSRSPFKKFGLNYDLLLGIVKHDIHEATRLQEMCLRPVLKGRDFICQASSGAGKSLIHMIVTLELLNPKQLWPQVLVLCPTAIMAITMLQEYRSLAKYLPNIKMGVRLEESSKQHIVIGTPEGILALLHMNVLDLGYVKYLVLDECEPMLKEMPIRSKVEEIFPATSQNKQVMMFSSSLSMEMRDVCRKFTRRPIEIFRDRGTPYALTSLQQRYIDMLNMQNGENELKDHLNTLREAEGLLLNLTSAEDDYFEISELKICERI